MDNDIVNNEKYFEWYNSSEKLRMRYPSEFVIGFLKNNLSKPGRVLDLGCGSGRHVILSAEIGHEAFGIDMSEKGFSFCRQIANKKNLLVDLSKSFIHKTKFEDSFFDAIICYSTISANSLEMQIIIISEIFRILKPGGILLINFYGEKDGTAILSLKEGTRVGENTYSLSGNLFHKNENRDVPDYLFHFSTSLEIDYLLQDFNLLRQFEVYLPFGNASLADNVKPTHLLYAVAKK